jgi:histidinol-phosphate aminotransferase
VIFLAKEPVRPGLNNIKPYVPGKPAEEAERELNIEGIIKMASNENPLGPSQKAIDAVIKHSKTLHVYPDQACFELKSMLSDKLNMPTENIAVGNGSDELMMLVGLAYLSAGDEVIISHNTFSTYETVARLMDASIVHVNLKDQKYDLDGMAKRLTPRTKLVFVCSPNNPTGTISGKAEMDKLVAAVPPETLIVIDEAYGEFVESKDYPDSLAYVRAKKNVIVMRTFSKIYGLAGLRIGYAMARPEIIRYMELVRMPFSVNRIGQMAASAALTDMHHVDISLKNNREGKAYLYAELDKLGLAYVKTEANFIYIDMKDDADRIFIEMMRRGVIIRPLASFGLPGSIRVTIGTPEQNKKFIRSLTEVLK